PTQAYSVISNWSAFDRFQKLIVVHIPHTAAFGTDLPDGSRAPPFGLPDVLKIRLKRPAGLELRRVANLEKCFEVAGVCEALTPIEATHVIGYAGISEASSKSVMGAVGEYAAESDATIDIKIDQVLFRRSADHSGEYANAFWTFAVRHARNELI